MSPHLNGDVVLANLKTHYTDFSLPPFIAVTSDLEYHDTDGESSPHARDRHFIAGRNKISNSGDIKTVLKIYRRWLEDQKENTCQSSRSVKRQDTIQSITNHAELRIVGKNDRDQPSVHTSSKTGKKYSKVLPEKIILTSEQGVDETNQQNADETELSCLGKCLKRFGGCRSGFLDLIRLY